MYWILCILLLQNLVEFMGESVYPINGDNVFRSGKKKFKGDFQQYDLSYSIFSSVEDYQFDAKEISESQYPWIARVIHSITNDYPHVCTCSCIDKFIFITSARCLTVSMGTIIIRSWFALKEIFSLRVYYTRVIYNGHKFHAKAFITPTNITKQSYDDIGFIVVMADTGYEGKWDTVQLFNKNRTDNDWRWFAELLKRDGNGDHKAIGFAIKKRKNRLKSPRLKFLLSELEVVLGMELCAEIYTANYRIKGFYVPCYFGCDLEEFRKEKNSTRCSRAHGVEGGAVYNTKTNQLLGVTTWGSFYNKHEMPWGFSVPNSENFFMDKECAIKVRDDKTKDLKPGYLQTLCPN